MTDMDEIAKACFDRQEFERHEDRPSHIIEKWDDIDETAKTYWREFVKPLLSFIRAAELRGRASGMREAAMMASEYSAATHGYLPSDPFSAAEKCRDEIVSGLKLAASKLSPT